MYSNERADQISGGVFLIGLGLMFTNILPWWPGIMFVLGASSIAKGLAQGKRSWQALQGGIWLIGIGLLFGVGFNLWLLLILTGVAMLFGWQWNKSSGRDRRQERERLDRSEEHDWVDQGAKRKNDEYLPSDTEGDTYRIGDDGELIKVKNDQKYGASRK